MKTNSPAYRHGSLLLASLIVAASPLLAQSPTAMTSAAGNPLSAVLNRAEQGTSPASVIANVGLTHDGQHSTVHIDGTGPLKYRAQRMKSPDRLVLDFSATRLSVKQSKIAGEAAPIQSIRMAQYKPEIARVVIDLTSTAQYSIKSEGKAVVVVFDDALAPAAQATPSSVSSSSAANAAFENDEVKLGDPKAEIRPVKFVVEQSRPTATHARRVTAVQAPRIQLPAELTQPSVHLASFGGTRQPLAPRGAQEPASQQAAPVPAQTQVPRPAQANTPPPATSGKYTGEPISVNLKDVDLKDFFRLIHEISGLNVVLDPAVKGTLTIVLDEVPWDQALDIVLQNNGLDKQISGNVLRVATRDTLKREAETSRDLAKAQNDAIDPVTWTKVLSYSKAETMRDTLKRFLTPRGEILADIRSNTVIVRDIPAVIPPIENLIRQLDRKSQQVEIEARVVSASRAFSRDIGVQLGMEGTTTGGRSLFGGASQVGTSPVANGPSVLPPLTTAGTTSMPLLVNLGAGVPTSGVTFLHRSPNFALDLFITAAEAKGIGKLLSKPKVITQNNEKAVVKQGTKIPIQTTINNTISVQFIDAVLRLEVTPQITAEGTVFMDVLVENTQIDNGIPRVQGIPALNTQSAETKVTVLDGGTVVIGGIIISQQRTDITEVPFIGSLPLIGHLFRRTNINNTAQELLFFLTPRVLPG